MYETNIIDLKKSWYILCYSYRWQNEKKIHSVALNDFPAYKKDPEDDSALCKRLHKLFSDADVIISHNIKFDIKKANARFIKHSLPPPSPYKTYCTLQQARRHFAFTSNRLNDLGRYLGLGRKMPHTGWDMWRKVMHGDAKAWATMRRYCSRDIELLIDVYERIKAWSPSHPRLTAYSDKPGCPTCESPKVQRRGNHIALKRKTPRFHCQSCGHWFT